MKYFFLFFCLFLIFQISHAQQREYIKGKLLYKNTNVPGANVVNNTAQYTTITDSNGEFEIAVFEGDEIIFSSVQYKIRTLLISSEMLKNSRIVVSVNESVTELDEVVVTADNVEKFLDLKEEEFKGFDYERDKSSRIINRAMSQGNLSNGIDFVNIAKLIFQIISKNNIEDKKKIKPSQILPYVFDDIFFLEDLALNEEEIVGFLEYIDMNFPSEQLLKQSQQLQLIDFLIRESEVYKNRID